MFGYKFKRWDATESVDVNPKKESLEDVAKWTNKQRTTENSWEEKHGYEIQWSGNVEHLKETVEIGLNS